MNDCRVYVSSGRLGDVIQVLGVIHARWKAGFGKGIFMISEDPRLRGDTFNFGLEATYVDLGGLLAHQEYIESFHMHRTGDMFPEKLINLSAWRYVNGGGANWIQMLERVYNVTFPSPSGPWLKAPSLSPIDQLLFHGKVAIHRSYMRHHNELFPWEAIVTLNPCVFVTCNMKEYEGFAWKDKVEVYHAKNLSEYAGAIASSRFYVGNQSSPSALAWALGKRCLIELYQPCAHMYMNPNIMWYLNDVQNNLVDTPDCIITN